MTNKELVSAVAKKSDYLQRDVKKVLETLENVIVDRLSKEEEVKLFHGFSVVGTMKDQHIARNPKSGEEIVVPAKIAVKAKISPSFKKRVNE